MDIAKRHDIINIIICDGIKPMTINPNGLFAITLKATMHHKMKL